MALLINNPVTWSNLQLQGGWKRVALIVGAVVIALPALVFSTQSTDSSGRSNEYTFWYWALFAIQLLLLGAIAPSRVHSAIKRDRQLKLIETLRLMPTPSSHAIVGYVLGPNVTLLAVSATLFVLGIPLALGAGVGVAPWCVLNGAALITGLLSCCLTAFIAQNLPRLHPMAIFIPAGIFLSASGALALPGMRLLAYPAMGGLRALQSGLLDWKHVASLVAQVLIAGILLVGAMRRFRRDDAPTLGVDLGLMLALVWSILTIVGTVGLADMPQGFAASILSSPTIGFIASLMVALAVASIPIASGAASRSVWRRRRTIDPHFAERTPLPLIVVLVVSTLVVSVVLIAAPESRLVEHQLVPFSLAHYAASVAVILLVGLTIAGLSLAASNAGYSPAPATLIYMIAVWAIPPIIDMIRSIFSDGPISTTLGVFSCASPVGTLWAVWTDRRDLAVTGLVAHLIVLIAGVWAMWALFKRFRKPAVTA